ncbi:MAG: hypothetical protein HGB21_15855 [Nitrospirae bacterium]|nr:hypothetical protein [Nitrospirota bacterium]
MNYDVGNRGLAYSDTRSVNEDGLTGAPYNSGWKYRNDGVDINTTSESGGYKVSWIDSGEWLNSGATVSNLSVLTSHTVEFNEVNGYTKPAYIGKVVSNRYLIGTNLSNHHPIGFDYNAVAAVDDEIYDSSSALGGSNPYGLVINDLLWNGKMECSTCHDVHNTKNEGQKFTWVEDYQSALCLTCHRK